MLLCGVFALCVHLYICFFMIPLTVFSPIIAGVYWGLGNPVTCLKLDIRWRGDLGFKGRPYYNFACIHFCIVFCCILLSNWNSGKETWVLGSLTSPLFEIPCLNVGFLGTFWGYSDWHETSNPTASASPNTRITDTPTSPVGQFIFIPFCKVFHQSQHREVP